MNQVILFRNTGCSYCRKFEFIQNDPAFIQGLLSLDAELVIADRTADPAAYDRLFRIYGKGMTVYPSLVCVVSGKRTLLTSARASAISPYTTARTLDMLKPWLCSGCEPVQVPVPGVCPTCAGKKRALCPTCGTSVKCWTCNGTGKV